jgi:hypothetical protein
MVKLALSILCLFLTALTARAEPLSPFAAHRETNITAKSQPTVNSAPQHYLTITGTKPRELEIWFAIDFIADNSDCFHRGIGQLVAGSPGDAPEILDVVAVKSGEQNFEVKMPLDRYLPGYCGWHATSVNESTFVGAPGSAPLASTSMNNISASGFSELQSQRDCKSTYDDYWKRNFIFCTYGRHVEGWVQLNRAGARVEIRYEMQQ